MIEVPQCYKRNCKHYQGVKQPDGIEETERPVCDAYPNRIPDDIAYGDSFHKEVRNDQENNIVYKENE